MERSKNRCGVNEGHEIDTEMAEDVEGSTRFTDFTTTLVQGHRFNTALGHRHAPTGVGGVVVDLEWGLDGVIRGVRGSGGTDMPQLE